MSKLGVVAIGRNEGARLRACLASVKSQADAIVYVDSGSTDGSLEWAQKEGVHTVSLDRSKPFSAARARNEGFGRLMQVLPNADWVQFIDGDCEIFSDWLAKARSHLEEHPKVAVVCGRRRERFPEASVYNLLCDLEWDTPVGDADACGGDALMRTIAFQQAGGYRDSLIAGEEPELCLRLRSAGWKISRIEADMTKHDAAMTRFGQWWKRAVRAGHAFAECSWLHRRDPLTIWRRETRSNWFWGVLIPLVAVAGAWWTYGTSLLLLLGYPLLAFRVYRSRRRRGDSTHAARWYAVFCVAGKFANAWGQLRYHFARILGHRSSLIEYKSAAATPQNPTALRVAYLVNQYPHVSHSFIRREIVGLESHGVSVTRFSVRPSGSALVDPFDQAEQRQTHVLLGHGLRGLAWATLSSFIRQPVKSLRALRQAIRMGWRSERGVARHFIYFAEACILVRGLHSSGVSHLHAHFGTNSTTVALLAHMLGGPPYSFTVHGPEEFDHPDALSLGDKIKHSAMVVAISSYGRSQLYRWCPLEHWPKIQVIHCGVDAAFLKLGPQPLPEEPRLVCVGRLSEQKGQLFILEALAQLVTQEVQFLMTFAGDGPMRSEVEKRIRELGLEKHVRITGWLSNDQVRQEMLASQILVLPSFAEGLPVVIMEALALGRPVITTYVAGIPELVEPGTHGWLIPAGSVDELATALKQALTSPRERLAEMGRAGALRVQQRHDVVTESAKLAHLFRKCIDKPVKA